MRTRSTRYGTAVGLIFALGVGGCAAGGQAGSGSDGSSGSGLAAGSSALPAASSPSMATQAASSSGPAVPTTTTTGTTTTGTTTTGTTTAGTAAGIPAAPNTAGTAALPPTSAAAPVTSDPGIVATPLPNCNPSTLRTNVKGEITFTTGGTVREPWFVGSPNDGRGYEAAVAQAVAKELGFGASMVRWTTSNLGEVASGHPGNAANFDVALGELATPDGESPVDHSTGYFSMSESVVIKTGARAPANVAAMKNLRVAEVPTAGTSPVSNRLPASRSSGYPSVAAAVSALNAGAVDALILPTPTAVVTTGVTVVGQLADGKEQPRQFGMVLAKKSPLTSCVSAAIDQLRVTGTLSTLLAKWIPAAAKPLR